MGNKPEKRIVKPGELLAIDPRSLIKSPDAFFWMFAPACPPPKRVGNTCIVYVRGGLEHHADGYSCSYESIVADVKCAWEGDGENEPAERVILAIDSPGGVVSGLYECVDQLKELTDGRPFEAYAEGLCASAAYALACSCSKIIASRSSILGSVGVIATMYSQSRRDKAMGIDVITITSGKRKADGHPHVAISDAAIKAEEKRVSKFAAGFFDIVQEARDVDPEPYEAGLFVGKDAVRAGFADKIGTLAEFIASQEKSLAKLSQPDTAQSGTIGANMRLSKLIEKTKAAIKSEKDVEKKASLRLRLAAYQQTLADTKKTYEKETETEETTGEDDEEEEESSDDDDDDGGGGNKTDREEESDTEEEDAESDTEEEDAESEDDEKKAEDDKDEKKAIAEARKLKGKAGKAILSALLSARSQRKAMLGELGATRKLGARVDKLFADNEKRDRNALIDGALAAGRITPGEAKQLRKQSTIEVGAFLSARPKAIVRQNSLAPNLKESASLVSQQMSNFAPSDVTAEITTEMREAAERVEMLSGGKVKAADYIKSFLAEVTAPKEHH